ncbi:hypothetical protein Pcinc_024258, partial [Petrolisthes cinctipes]
MREGRHQLHIPPRQEPKGEREREREEGPRDAHTIDTAQEKREGGRRGILYSWEGGWVERKEEGSGRRWARRCCEVGVGENENDRLEL